MLHFFSQKCFVEISSLFVEKCQYPLSYHMGAVVTSDSSSSSDGKCCHAIICSQYVDKGHRLDELSF